MIGEAAQRIVSPRRHVALGIGDGDELVAVVVVPSGRVAVRRLPMGSMVATGRLMASNTVCHELLRPPMRLVRFPTALYWKRLLLAAPVPAAKILAILWCASRWTLVAFRPGGVPEKPPHGIKLHTFGVPVGEAGIAASR